MLSQAVGSSAAIALARALEFRDVVDAAFLAAASSASSAAAKILGLHSAPGSVSVDSTCRDTGRGKLKV